MELQTVAHPTSALQNTSKTMSILYNPPMAQEVYTASLPDEVTTDTTRGAWTVKDGTAGVEPVYEGKNNADLVTYQVMPNGDINTSGAITGTITSTDVMSSQTSDFSASATQSTTYLIDSSAANITITMPTAASGSGLRHTFLLTGTSGTNTALIDHDIDGNASGCHLFMLRDSVEVISDGTNWHLANDRRQAHVAKMSRKLSQQSINQNTWTNVEFDATEFDNADIATSGASSRFTARRPGRYMVTGLASMEDIDDGNIVQSGIAKNGTVVFKDREVSPAANSNMFDSFAIGFCLVTGDSVSMEIHHNEVAARDTSIADNGYCRMCVSEIRP